MKTVLRRYFDKDAAFLAALPGTFWLMTFLILPLALLLFKAFTVEGSGYIRHLFSFLDATHCAVLLRSSLISAATAVFCLVLSYPIAYYLSFCVPKSWRSIGILLCTLPMWINMLVQVYAWFYVLDRNGLLNTMLLQLGLINSPLHLLNSQGAVLLGMVQTYLPFVALPLFVSFERFDLRLIEASMDLGATWSQTFFRVLFPLTLSGAQVGFFLVLVMTFGDYALPSLLGGSKYLFVGTLISNYVLVSRDLVAGASFTIVSFLCLGLLVLLFAMLFRWLSKGIRL